MFSTYYENGTLFFYIVEFNRPMFYYYFSLTMVFQAVLYVFVLIIPFVLSDTSVVLDTKLGKIRGKVVRNNTVYRFTKIPYGKPPVGELRFSKPEEYGAWNGTLDAMVFPPSCMQFSYLFFKYLPTQEVSEDCLFLNIYMPRKGVIVSKMSVMVFFHGGGFVMGQASDYDGGDLAADGDVIVVVVNYRLGIFGFLSSGDSVSPGNYGLWDQRLALQWIKENIEDFSGNPNSVTVVGSTAGAMCSSLHALSPINKGLFQRAIFQSGIALSELVITAGNTMKFFGNAHNCTSTNSDEILACLRGKLASDLVDPRILFDGNSIAKVKVGPVIDGTLIQKHPQELLKDSASESYKFVRSLDIIVGTTSAEGSVWAINLNPLKLSIQKGISTSDLCDVTTPALSKEFYKDKSKTVSDKICNKYKATNKEEQGRQVVNLFTDFLFVNPATEYLNAHSKENKISKTYQYSFGYQKRLGPLPDWLHGAIHGADKSFLFGYKKWADVRNVTITEDELVMSKNMILYWTNFAKTGYV